MVRTEPPDERPATADSCSAWLIDHGNVCLWPPKKFGATLNSVEDVPVTQSATMLPHLEAEIGNTMPAPFRTAYASLNADQRLPYLDRITAFPENVIRQALNEVPDAYMSATAKSLTEQLLLARRDQIGSLSNTVFPLPPGN